MNKYISLAYNFSSLWVVTRSFKICSFNFYMNKNSQMQYFLQLYFEINLKCPTSNKYEYVIIFKSYTNIKAS